MISVSAAVDEAQSFTVFLKTFFSIVKINIFDGEVFSAIHLISSEGNKETLM